MSNLQDKLFNLPHDLKLEIFNRLPINYLYIFRSVSKSWLNLIQTPFLIEVQVKKSHTTFNNPLVVIPGGGNQTILYFLDFHCPDNLIVARLMEVNYPMNDSEKRVNLVGTCNGLICIENTNIFSDNSCYYYYPSPNITFTFWNPFTGIYRIVADKSDNSPKSWSAFNGDCFDSSCYFGYDHVKDDYHIVRVTMPHPNQSHMWEPNPTHIYDYGFILDIYSLKNDSWTKIINQEFQKEWFVFTRSGVFHSGTLYMIGKPKENNDTPYYPMIVAFDVATQTFRLVVLPCQYHGCYTIDLDNILGELDGRLSVYKCPWLGKDKHLVWLMNNEDDGIKMENEDLWSKTIKLKTRDLEVLGKLLPYPTGLILGMFSCCEMIWCDPQTRLSTNILIENIEELSEKCLLQKNACVCSRTMVSPFLV